MYHSIQFCATMTTPKMFLGCPSVASRIFWECLQGITVYLDSGINYPRQTSSFTQEHRENFNWHKCPTELCDEQILVTKVRTHNHDFVARLLLRSSSLHAAQPSFSTLAFLRMQHLRIA